MKTWKGIVGLAFLLGLAALAVSCTSKESPFVGKWTPQDPAAPRENMELCADHTLVLGKRGDEPSTGTWTVLDDGRLKMDVRMTGMMGMNFAWVAELKGEVMTFTIYDKQVSYVRLKP